MKRSILITGLILCLLIPSSLWAGTSRKLPTSYNESTYGNATRDYTVLATWEAATDNDLVTAAKGEVLTCYDDDAPYDDFVSISGATTNASYFRVIRAASGDEGTFSSGVRFTTSSSFQTFNLDEEYLCMYDIFIENTYNHSYIPGACVYVIKNETRIIGCSATGTSDGAGVRGFFVDLGETTDVGYIINCAIKGCKLEGLYLSKGVLSCYNCTSVANKYGFYRYSGTAIAKNCIAQGNTSGQFYGTWTQTTNVTSGVTFDSDGYHLASTDTHAKDQGTNLSSDSNFAFNDDIDGDTRSGTWDVGCDELPSASTWKPQVIFY